MPLGVAYAIALTLLVTTFVVIVTVIATRRRKAQEEEMQRAASARGWKFESKLEGGGRMHRWTGSTDGVSWTAESFTRTSGSKNNHQRVHVGRWHGAWSPGISGAVVAIGLPKGKEDIATKVAEGDGFFARMAQKAAGFALDKAIDVYFGVGPGKEVDAAALHRVNTHTPGFVVMAANKDEGARVMQQGFEQALVAAANDKGSLLSDEHRPWVLLRPGAVSLARMHRFRDVHELERFIRAGVALTRAFKFGRPFA
jgi:hypothetical protein